MRSAVLDYRMLYFAGIIALGFLRLASAAEPLLIVEQPEREITFLNALPEGKLQFAMEGKMLDVSLQELIRWSTPSKNIDHRELLLTDGSRLVVADAWTVPSWQMDGDTIVVTTKLFGKVDLQRNQIRALLLHAPKGLKQRGQFLDRLLVSKRKLDTIYLINGDEWQGRVEALVESSKSERLIHLRQKTATDPLPLPEKRIAAITFAPEETLPVQEKRLVVGLRDGSMLTAKSLVTDAQQLHVLLAGGVEINASGSHEVVYLRSLTPTCFYLSDLTPIDYQPTPFLEIPSPYRRDRNVLGGPLVTAGRSYAKGLGMLTSSRLIYSLDVPKQFRRFVASVAIDDEALHRGSVIFRVLLRTGDDWKEVFASPIVRGGETPLAVMVDLGNAKQIALVTDFADRGDECDYANWLDARLE